MTACQDGYALCWVVASSEGSRGNWAFCAQNLFLFFYLSSCWLSVKEVNCLDPYSLKVKEPRVLKMEGVSNPLNREAVRYSLLWSVSQTYPFTTWMSILSSSGPDGKCMVSNSPALRFLIPVLWEAELLGILLWLLAKRPQVRYINSKLSPIKYQCWLTVYHTEVPS